MNKCKACGCEHKLRDGTWVILGTGDLVCANNTCWRVIENGGSDAHSNSKIRVPKGTG